jgi:peptidoglycan/xylan/chitin deacetylase (PgdA/CDA1 family)
MAAGAAGRARPGAILILHDGREARGGPRGESVAAVGPLIDRLRDDGYSFTTADQLLGVPAYQDV